MASRFPSKDKIEMITSAFSMMEIHNADLSVRARNVLYKQNLYTFADLIEFIQDNGISGLLKIKHFGTTTLTEVTLYMHDRFQFNILGSLCVCCDLPAEGKLCRWCNELETEENL